MKDLTRRTILNIFVLLFCTCFFADAQDTTVPKLWHNQQRVMNYHPDGGDIVITNGKHRFNRALYGGNTAFRVEAGDLPEFALYLPGMGGNLKLGLITGSTSKWITDATKIEARYRAGSMIYEIEDPMLGRGTLTITIVAGSDAETMIIQVWARDVNFPVSLFWAYGGATGKKFSRDGDLGADPESSFYLKPEYCQGNTYQIENNAFILNFAGKSSSEADRYEIKQPGSDKSAAVSIQQKQITGLFPIHAVLHTTDANQQGSPWDNWKSTATTAPMLAGQVPVHNQEPMYLYLQNGNAAPVRDYQSLSLLFSAADRARAKIADRIKVNTPDPFINTLGGVLSIAADAIWESPSYMHGAVAWRMRLNAWRGPYVADALGWHDRAQSHFSSYALSQITEPESGPVVADTALHDARQLEKLGTAMFSSGYISRNPGGKIVPHHYDMNLVYIDALLNHFKWTGDLKFVKEMWPVIKRHLAWEKRNFDADGDGLYDAYCAIWASDALQYSGGGVTHSSAYNYKANKMAAELAKLLGEDPAPYQKEADHILTAINKTLWLPQTGQYAEYQDLLGEKMVHPSAALWTVYHAIDSEVPDKFQAYQALRYIDNNIPHIPIVAKGAPTGLYTLATTNWMPYTWSLNNVVLAEGLHTSLAYWQGNRAEEAFKIWKGALIESMFLESSPGNFENMSYYDANRGELYRDFGDPIGMAGRTLVEGLFGIHPDALKDTLTIAPGFPKDWDHASLKTPDIELVYKRTSSFKGKLNDFVKERYEIIPSFSKSMNLIFQIQMHQTHVGSVTINGQKVEWQNAKDAIETPVLEVKAGKRQKYEIEITYYDFQTAATFDHPNCNPESLSAEYVGACVEYSKLLQWYTPQSIFNKDRKTVPVSGHHTAFVKLNQHGVIWWSPMDFVTASKLPETAQNWDAVIPSTQKLDTVSLTPYFNDQVTNIFKNKYLNPRPQSPTLQLPWQGIGNWCYPLVSVNIDDSGLRNAAGDKNEFTIPQGIRFATPGTIGKKNIVFTSQWDNYPKQVDIPLNGKSSHAYFLMAGSTNPMQSRITNGQVIVVYNDNTTAVLDLKNPETWWPIEQDYEDDGYAFQLNAPKPPRVYLKSGQVIKDFKNFTNIKGFSNRGIDGGAATVLDLPLDPTKELKSLRLKTLANDVVIGLMSVTLVRVPNH